MRAILLGAGMSKRMGTQKLLLPFNGKTVLETVIECLMGVGFEQVLLVTTSQITHYLGKRLDHVAVLINNNPTAGQSESLKIGLNALKNQEDFCLMLGDLPLISTEEVKKIKGLFENRDGSYTAVVPFSKEAYGHPAFFSSIWKKRFSNLTGDTGGRKIITENVAEVLLYRGADSFFFDIDTEQDYQSAHLIKK